MWRRMIWRLVMPVGIVAIVAGALWMAFTFRDPALLKKSQDLQADLNSLLQKNEQLSREIAALENENQRLREDPEASLYYVRTEAGMLRPGETLYQFVEVAEEAPRAENRDARAKPKSPETRDDAAADGGT